MNILYFAPIPFEEIKQRPQCLAEELSKDNAVYYVEPTVSLMRCLIKREGKWQKEEKIINDKIEFKFINKIFSIIYRIITVKR